MSDPKVVELSDLTSITIRVTDDEEALEASEAAGPDYRSS
jgi:hypothetical protein